VTGEATVNFSKADYADWTLPENQDCITDNVCLTRQNIDGLYNTVQEDGVGDTSPADTERAV